MTGLHASVSGRLWIVDAAAVMVALLLKPGEATAPDERPGQARAVTTARSAR